MSENTEGSSATAETTAPAGTAVVAEQSTVREGEASVGTTGGPSWESERAQLQSELENMRRRAENFEKGLKEFQRKTTPRLQKLTELERQAERDGATREELLQLRTIVGKLADTLLEDKDKEQLGIQIEKARLEWQRQALARQQQAQTEQAQQADSYVDQETYKLQLFQQYAPNTAVDPTDPRIDWAGDAKNLPEWVKRFNTSILTIEKADAEKRNQEVIANLQKTNTEALRTSEQEAARRAEEARIAAKKEEEERLRALGVDIVDTAPQGESRGGSNEVENYLDEGLLKTAAGRLEYQRREREMRNKLFAR